MRASDRRPVDALAGGVDGPENFPAAGVRHHRQRPGIPTGQGAKGGAIMPQADAVQ
jgi:hypothetical protein